MEGRTALRNSLSPPESFIVQMPSDVWKEGEGEAILGKRPEELVPCSLQGCPLT